MKTLWKWRNNIGSRYTIYGVTTKGLFGGAIIFSCFVIIINFLFAHASLMTAVDKIILLVENKSSKPKRIKCMEFNACFQYDILNIIINYELLYYFIEMIELWINAMKNYADWYVGLVEWFRNMIYHFVSEGISSSIRYFILLVLILKF